MPSLRFLRLTPRLLARKKGGQQAWTPNSQAAGVSPTSAVSGSEMLHMIYRPLPPDQTVEYEEDFGNSMMIQREFISKRQRDRMTFDVAPLAYSDLELQKARQQLATQMNQERQSHARAAGGSLQFETQVDPETREVISARYLFDNKRMEYCERFQAVVDRHLERLGLKSAAPDGLHALMEAAAILFGCGPDTAQQESYFRIFLKLDRDSLDEEAETLRAMRMDQDDVVKRLMAAGDDNDDLRGEFEDEANGEASPRQDVEAVLRELPKEFMEYAPLVKSYQEHVAGESPIVRNTNLSASLARPGISAERQRWRKLLEVLVAEDYHRLTPMDVNDAVTLNEQLNSVKLFDLRLGDVVREIVQISRRATGTGGSLHAEVLDQSPTHPERRHSEDGV